jgi:hypothetical protein
MRKGRLFFLLALILVSCGGHRHRVDGDDLFLVLIKPDAARVVLYCSLDGFKARSAVNASGVWEVKLPADESFSYFYRVDDRHFLPDCPLKEKDDFGSENCIFDPGL